MVWCGVVWYDIRNLGREDEEEGGVGLGRGLGRKEGWVCADWLVAFFFSLFSFCLDWIGLDWIVRFGEWLFFGRGWMG